MKKTKITITSFLKKKTKVIVASLILVINVGIITYFALPNSFPTINMAGSSAVSPLAILFANEYEGDIVVQSGGSGLGIEVALNGKKDIGMASKNPNKDYNGAGTEDKLTSGWIEEKIKTITIAWDGMGIVYVPPKDDLTFELKINEKNIGNIYSAFSGHERMSMDKLGSTSKEFITPFARDGGGKQSGTAEAFFTTSGFKWENNFSPEEQKLIKDSLENGSYGAFTKKTAEANSQSWDFFKTQNIPGSMVYLSAGFILNNIKEIQSFGYKTAQYEYKDESGNIESLPIDSDRITTGYNWYRPLNLMVSITRASDPIKEFIDWILINETASILIKDAGYIELTNVQKNTMKDGNDFWVPDTILLFCGAK